MKILVCKEPGILEYGLAEKPEPRIGWAIIRIRRIGVCGTDLHAFEGVQPFFNYPRILGHELSGELTDNGGNTEFEVGETVTVIPYLNCGHCIACQSGKPNCCTRLQVLGIHIDGGMAEWLQVPARLLVHGGGLSLDQLAMIEPLAIGAHGIRRAMVKQNEFVLIVGAGPIGLGLMEFARVAGGNVIAVDINQQRLGFCREKLGIQYTIDAMQENVPERLSAITRGDMPTVVIDATGNQKAINNSLNYLAHGGRYILVGLQRNELIFSHPEFHKREATLMSSRNATREDFEQVINCIQEGLVNPNNYITHQVGFDEVKQNFDSWLNPENEVIKAMIHFDETTQ